LKPREVEGLDPRGRLKPNVARIVEVRLDELRSFAPAALGPAASEAQHDMRIAAKRLRYVLELFAPCLGEEAEVARRAAKRLQSALGDLRDCDLMLAKVDGIASVAALLHDRRARLFNEFVELWQAEASKGTWSALELHAASFFLE
jgi:CHAD domain-containing protein